MAKLSKNKEQNKGGDAGEIFIAARRIQGNGKILANGGEGGIGGKGGKVTLITEDNNFQGEISAKGGSSKFLGKWHEKWWMKYIVFPLVVVIIGVVITFIIEESFK